MKQIQLQIAFFLSQLINRPDEVFYNNLVNEYNQPVILPMQKPLPGLIFADAPIVQAKSKNGMYDLSIYNMRLDLTIKNFSLKLDDDIIKRHYDLIKSYLVNRVGFVAHFIETKENSSQIFKKYLKLDEGASEVSIRYNKKSVQNGININDVMNIQDVEFEENGKKQKGVLFVRDINTNPLLKKEISLREILSLYQYSNKLFATMSREGI